MKEVTITLLDGEHVLKTPSYYGLQLIDENGGNDEGSLMASLPAVLAAILTDSEPLSEKGLPKKYWNPIEVAKLIPTGDEIATLWESLSELLEDAVPQAKAKDEGGNRPTKTPPGAKKQ